MERAGRAGLKGRGRGGKSDQTLHLGTSAAERERRRREERKEGDRRGEERRAKMGEEQDLGDVSGT